MWSNGVANKRLWIRSSPGTVLVHHSEHLGHISEPTSGCIWIVYNIIIIYINYAARNRTRSNFKMDVYDSCLRSSLQKKNREKKIEDEIEGMLTQYF